MGTGQEDQKIRLSELIDILNERFGTDFTQADQLFFDQIQEEAIESETLKKAAAANSKDDFRYVFEKAFEGLVIDRMEGNEEIFGKLMADGEFRKLAVEHLLHKVYGALKNPKDKPLRSRAQLHRKRRQGDATWIRGRPSPTPFASTFAESQRR